MSTEIAVTYGAEGAGNAVRMLAIAEELRKRDIDVELAGGGPGTMFMEMNGFDPAEPTTVDFIDRRRDSLLKAVAGATPEAVQRFRDFYGWMREHDPSLVLTDDPLCMLPARIQGIPIVRADHALTEHFHDPLDTVMYTVFNGYTLRAAEAFYHTCLWPDEPHDGVTRIGPVAHDPDIDLDVDPFDVLIIPGTYSEGFERLRDDLEQEGYETKYVGGEDWETVPAMLPVTREADLVICTGFSSIAEAAVAGTPCIVQPFIDCQHGIADAIRDHDVEGIEVVDSLDGSLEMAKDILENGHPTPPSFENGAVHVAEDLVDRFL